MIDLPIITPPELLALRADLRHARSRLAKVQAVVESYATGPRLGTEAILAVFDVAEVIGTPIGGGS